MHNLNQGFNRRNFIRENIHTPIRYGMKSTNNFGATLTKDISEGGVRIILDNFLALNTEVKLNLSLPEITRSISALGKISWSQNLPCSERYQFGVEFTQINSEDKKHLLEFLREKRLKAAFNL